MVDTLLYGELITIGYKVHKRRGGKVEEIAQG